MVPDKYSLHAIPGNLLKVPLEVFHFCRANRSFWGISLYEEDEQMIDLYQNYYLTRLSILVWSFLDISLSIMLCQLHLSRYPRL